MPELPPLNRDSVLGCLLGQAMGDALGLPAENLSPRRIARLFPRFDRPRFVFGHGMGSDDTEHACMTATALLHSGGDVDRFRKSLGWRLRWWLLSGPPGIGLATLKSCLKLWLGWSSRSSGVYSAGNGPAMRAAILGVVVPEDKLEEFCRASTCLTHTDPRAIDGALLVALVAKRATEESVVQNPSEFLTRVLERLPEARRTSPVWLNLQQAQSALERQLSVPDFARELGLKRGVSGYIAHTVPVAIFAFLRHAGDYRTAIEQVISCGGDTDTVAAITGALVGARVGKAGIPPEWLTRWIDWPRSIRWIESLGDRLSQGRWRTTPDTAPRLAAWAIPFRNAAFFAIVLGHLFRRLLPPYSRRQ